MVATIHNDGAIIDERAERRDGYDPASVSFPNGPLEHFLAASEAAKRGMTWGAYSLFVGDKIFDEQSWADLMLKIQEN